MLIKKLLFLSFLFFLLSVFKPMRGQVPVTRTTPERVSQERIGKDTIPARNDKVPPSGTDKEPSHRTDKLISPRMDSAKLLQSVEVLGRTEKSYKSDYSFFGTKTETPIIAIPQAISTITKELIKDKMVFTMKDAAGNASGVNDYSGYDEYTIRGFRAENARDINGLRGYHTTYTSAMLVNVERIEIIKGPIATLYGNCDPGGTINLVTKKPLEKQGGELSIAGGSWDHFHAEGDITGPLNKSKTLLYRMNAGYDQTHSFRDQVYAKSYQFAPSLSFVPNDRLKLNIDFSLAHINTVLDRGQPGLQDATDLKSTPIRLSVTQSGDFLHETDFSSIATFSYKLTKRLKFNAGYLHYHTRQNVADHGINDYITPDSVSLYYTAWDYRTTTNTLTAYFTYGLNTGLVSHQLFAGYDYVKSRIMLDQHYFELPDQFGEGSGIVGTFSLLHPQHVQRPVSTYQPSGFDSDGTDVDGSVYHTQGVYVQDLVSWKKWKLLFSLRQEFYKGDSDDSVSSLSEKVFLPRVGIVYSINSHTSLYATYNKGFDPFEVSTDAQVFDEPFKLITSQLYEAGIKANLFKDRLSASIAFYQLTLHNVAVHAGNFSNPNLFIQQGTDRSKGLEFEANGNIIPNLSVSLAYAHCVAEVLESKIAAQVGQLLENSPRNSSSSWIKYTFNKRGLKGLAIAFGHSQASLRNTPDPQYMLPGYTVFNAGLYYSYKNLSFSGVLNNLANTTYWSGAYNNVNKWPGRPRNMMIGIGWRW
ncbi:TonB-dependent siderophore receptor [Flavitalea flava]